MLNVYKINTLIRSSCSWGRHAEILQTGFSPSLANAREGSVVSPMVPVPCRPNGSKGFQHTVLGVQTSKQSTK